MSFYTPHIPFGPPSPDPLKTLEHHLALAARAATTGDGRKAVQAAEQAMCQAQKILSPGDALWEPTYSAVANAGILLGKYAQAAEFKELQIQWCRQHRPHDLAHQICLHLERIDIALALDDRQMGREEAAKIDHIVGSGHGKEVFLSPLPERYAFRKIWLERWDAAVEPAMIFQTLPQVVSNFDGLGRTCQREVLNLLINTGEYLLQWHQYRGAEFAYQLAESSSPEYSGDREFSLSIRYQAKAGLCRSLSGQARYSECFMLSSEFLSETAGMSQYQKLAGDVQKLRLLAIPEIDKTPAALNEVRAQVSLLESAVGYGSLEAANLRLLGAGIALGEGHYDESLQFISQVQRDVRAFLECVPGAAEAVDLLPDDDGEALRSYLSQEPKELGEMVRAHLSVQLECSRIRDSVALRDEDSFEWKMEREKSLPLADILGQADLLSVYGIRSTVAAFLVGELESVDEILRDLEAQRAAHPKRIDPTIDGLLVILKGIVSLQNDEYDKSARLLDEAIEKFQSEPGLQKSIFLVTAHRMRSFVESAQDNWEQALEYLEECIRILQSINREYHPLMLNVLEDKRDILSGRGYLDDAEEHDLRASAVRHHLIDVNRGKFFLDD